jgi:hypothetical protein
MLTKNFRLKMAGLVAAIAIAWGVLFSGGHNPESVASQPNDVPIMIVADGGGSSGPPYNGGG